MKNKKPGHIDTHRQTNSESPPKSICVYVTRRSNCRWPPKCSPLYLFYQTDTLYKSRTHLLIHPRSLFPDRYKYINTSFFCQYAKNTLTVFAVNVTVRQAFTTWRAVHCRPYLLLGKQCIPVRFGTWQAGPAHTGFANWQAGSGWLFSTLQAVY